MRELTMDEVNLVSGGNGASVEDSAKAAVNGSTGMSATTIIVTVITILACL